GACQASSGLLNEAGHKEAEFLSQTAAKDLGRRVQGFLQGQALGVHRFILAGSGLRTLIAKQMLKLADQLSSRRKVRPRCLKAGERREQRGKSLFGILAEILRASLLQTGQELLASQAEPAP